MSKYFPNIELGIRGTYCTAMGTKYEKAIFPSAELGKEEEDLIKSLDCPLMSVVHSHLLLLSL